MAVYITGDGLSYSSFISNEWNAQLNLYTTNFNSNVTVRFDGKGSGSDIYFGRWYDYVKVTKQEVTTTYETSSKSVTLTPSDFAYKDSNDSGDVYYKFEIGNSLTYGGDSYLRLEDIYLNGTKIGTVKPQALYCDSLKIYIWANRYYYVPYISMGDISIQSVSWNSLPIAGESILKVDSVSFGNAKSDDINNYYEVTVSVYSGSNPTVVRSSNTSIKITDIVAKSSEETSYTLTVSVSVRNRYLGSASATKSITIYPYHLPRLFLNRTGEVSYVSRCQQDGTADGLGSYGHLHLVWDVSPINTTGSGIINTLQSAVVVLNDTTTLSPSGGSIASGYLDYIFPLATETQGNLTITLTDTRKSNTITGLNVPKGSMPFSMYDDGSNIGVAFGCMATDKGAWMYMPFYLQSSTSGSTKMFRLCIDDNGNITAKAV